jgi:LPS sulfotransferase NodH
VTEPTKFVLLTTQRSGSTFIRLWLNDHPSVRCYSEIFLRTYSAVDGFKYYCEANVLRKILYYALCRPYLTKSSHNFVSKQLIRKYLNELYFNPYFTAPWTDIITWKDWENYQPRQNLGIERAVGFQLMYDQLDDYEYLKKWVISNNVRILHLVRKNILKLCLSRLVARETGRVHSFEQNTKNTPFRRIFVDPTKILPQMRHILKKREWISAMFASNASVEFSYEDFFSNYTVVSAKIFSFLGVKNVKLKFPNIEKVNPDSIEELIENYEEIAMTLKGTPFEQFLDQSKTLAIAGPTT